MELNIQFEHYEKDDMTKAFIAAGENANKDSELYFNKHSW